MKPPNIWRIFSSFFRHVSISKSDEARAEQQARLIAMPSRGCSSALAKERRTEWRAELAQAIPR